MEDCHRHHSISVDFRTGPARNLKPMTALPRGDINKRRSKMERISRNRNRNRDNDSEEPATLVQNAEQVVVSPPNFQIAKVKIISTAPLVMNKFSSENRRRMMEKQEAGSRSRKGAKREPKNFDAVYKGAMHVAEDG